VATPKLLGVCLAINISVSCGLGNGSFLWPNWNDGMMEYWLNTHGGLAPYQAPAFQHSNIPLFQLENAMTYVQFPSFL
jgi:hypothetical protein